MQWHRGLGKPVWMTKWNLVDDKMEIYKMELCQVKGYRIMNQNNDTYTCGHMCTHTNMHTHTHPYTQPQKHAFTYTHQHASVHKEL